MQLKVVLRLEYLVGEWTRDLALRANLGSTPLLKLLAVTQVGQIFLVKRTRSWVHRYAIATEHFIEVVSHILVHFQRVARGAVIVLKACTMV